MQQKINKAQVHEFNNEFEELRSVKNALWFAVGAMFLLAALYVITLSAWVIGG